ncbi:ABC transporter ATP-binding protein [candidate division KSB1 bacterium]|nr:ABC transporter ATP-binding protein [candidate division KSB1 bacterium]
MIELSNLSKVYGSLTAVQNLSLQVNNELFGFLGPNGAGKTTTIKMMTGLLKPSAGSIFINHIDLLKNPLECKKHFSLVPEQPYLYEKLTAREFVNFVIDIYKVPQKKALSRMEQLFDIFELTGRQDELIEGFSHGMKQKVALTAALVHIPKVIFLDEPTVGLDPKATRNLRDILVGLVKKGAAVFMSTHILEVAERMCDRVGIIHKGELIALGKPAELRQDQDQTLEDVFLALTESDSNDHVSNFLDER